MCVHASSLCLPIVDMLVHACSLWLPIVDILLFMCLHFGCLLLICLFMCLPFGCLLLNMCVHVYSLWLPVDILFFFINSEYRLLCSTDFFSLIKKSILHWRKLSQTLTRKMFNSRPQDWIVEKLVWSYGIDIYINRYQRRFVNMYNMESLFF